MATIGSCPMCQKKGVRLTEHHIVEAPDENGKAPSIDYAKTVTKCMRNTAITYEMNATST